MAVENLWSLVKLKENVSNLSTPFGNEALDHVVEVHHVGVHQLLILGMIIPRVIGNP